MAKKLAIHPKTAKPVDPDWPRIIAEVRAKANTRALLKELENLPDEWRELLNQVWQRFVWFLDDLGKTFIRCKGLSASEFYPFQVELYEKIDAFMDAIRKAAKVMHTLAKSQPVTREAFAEGYAPVERAASDLAAWRDKLSTAAILHPSLCRVRKARRGRKRS